MQKPMLIIFIDALPYDRASNIVNQISASTYSKSVPGVGYSINVKAELFAGLRPDDVGYFCEWNYDPTKKVSWLQMLLMKVFEFFGSKSWFLNRVFHKLISMKLKENVYAIPYRILPYLKCSGFTAYERGFFRPSLLSEGQFDRVLYSEEGVDDQKVFEAAIRKLTNERNKRLFISTAELDGVMHRYGMNSDKYESQIKLIEEYVVKIVKQFQEINGEEALYFIFSDHGMAPVLQAVKFDIESIFGVPGKGKYFYFIDATFYRVWVEDKALFNKMIDAFDKIKKGHVLSEKERAVYGISDKKHGDIIYMLDESMQFAPSFFGNDTCEAMHGYESQLDSQLGMFLSNLNGRHGDRISAMGIYKCIKSCL